MDNYSSLVFLAVVMVALGYTAGNAKSFNFWKMALLALFLLPFVEQFNHSDTDLWVMVVAFLFGFFMPYADVLQKLLEVLGDAVNSLRFRAVKEKKRQGDEQQRQSSQTKYDQEQARRKEQAKQYRQSQKQQKREDASSHGSRTNSEKRQHSSDTGSHPPPKPESLKSRYLQILGLEPGIRRYTLAEIKKAYRRQASKYHPDKHQDKSDRVIREMNERFKSIKEAYDWLAATP